MDNRIFNPLEDYEKTLKDQHNANAEAFFDGLERKSGIQVEENRATVKKYKAQQAKADGILKKAGRYKALRVLAIIGMVLAVLATFTFWPCLLLAVGLLLLWLLKLNPLIKNLHSIYEKEQAAADLLQQTCWQQMAPLNALFTDWDGITLLEKTIPLFQFQPHFPVSQEKNMRDNFDFAPYAEEEQSVIDTLSGTYNDNPFLFERRLVHTMGTETYHGYKTIHWTEHYTDNKGRRRSRTRSQTLHATVTRPKPFYHTETKLHYGAQAGPELSFSRENTHLEDRSERSIDRMVRKGERKLKKKAEDALENNQNFMGMTNTEFDVLFDALDRDHEVQFRVLFTPLAQTNMVALLRSETGYGEDFDFYKRKRMNTIVSEHNQKWAMRLSPDSFQSFDYDALRQQFLAAHAEYFKSIYFDFAPLLALPVYQDRPVHSLEPLPKEYPCYTVQEYEVLANAFDLTQLAHPDSCTQAILKASHASRQETADTVSVTAHSYNALERVEVVPMLGGDGWMHNVAVPWTEYIPLQRQQQLLVASTDDGNENIYKHGLYARVFKS